MNSFNFQVTTKTNKTSHQFVFLLTHSWKARVGVVRDGHGPLVVHERRHRGRLHVEVWPGLVVVWMGWMDGPMGPCSWRAVPRVGCLSAGLRNWLTGPWSTMRPVNTMSGCHTWGGKEKWTVKLQQLCLSVPSFKKLQNLQD